MTASPPVLSPNSVPPPSSYCTFIPAKKNSVHVSQMLFQYFPFLKKMRNLKLCKPGRVGTFLNSVRAGLISVPKLRNQATETSLSKINPRFGQAVPVSARIRNSQPLKSLCVFYRYNVTRTACLIFHCHH